MVDFDRGNFNSPFFSESQQVGASLSGHLGNPCRGTVEGDGESSRKAGCKCRHKVVKHITFNQLAESGMPGTGNNGGTLLNFFTRLQANSHNRNGSPESLLKQYLAEGDGIEKRQWGIIAAPVHPLQLRAGYYQRGIDSEKIGSQQQCSPECGKGRIRRIAGKPRHQLGPHPESGCSEKMAGFFRVTGGMTATGAFENGIVHRLDSQLYGPHSPLFQEINCSGINRVRPG